MPATKTDGKATTRKDRYEHAVSRLSDLPTIPNTLLRIWQLVDDPDSSASDLEKVITMDQALTAKILRLVNSPYYGIREPVTGCRQAIMLLGFDTVKNLSICVSVVSACLPDEPTNPELDLRELWKHSITTGVVADQIAAHAQVGNPDAAFTAGVLHDIGKFVMNIALRHDYGDVIALARNEGLFLREAEDSLVGANHQYFGAFLARMWGFPAQLVEAIEKHHEESRADGPLGVVEIVSLANRVARMLKVGSSGDTRSLELSPDTFATIQLEGDDADRFLSDVHQRVEDARDMMNLVG